VSVSLFIPFCLLRCGYPLKGDVGNEQFLAQSCKTSSSEFLLTPTEFKAPSDDHLFVYLLRSLIEAHSLPDSSKLLNLMIVSALYLECQGVKFLSVLSVSTHFRFRKMYR